MYFGDHDEADDDAADVATADDVDDADVGLSWKCENTTGSDCVGGIGGVPTGRLKDGGRDTESQRGMTTITMTTANKKVILGSAVGTVDRLGSVQRGSEDSGTEESVHGVSVGSCKSVSFDVEGLKSNACTTINKQ